MEKYQNNHGPVVKKEKSQTGKFIAVIVISVFLSVIASTGTFLGLNLIESALNNNSNASTASTQLFKNSGETKTVSVKEESAVTSAVQKVRPAVVSVIASKEVSTSGYASPFFDYYSGPTSDFSESEDIQKQKVGGGTGFFISSDGLVLTNKHVVEDETATYSVFDVDGNEYEAQILAKDPVQDVAILKIEGENFPVVELGDSESLEPGQSVIAVGNSLGEYSNTVTKGVVSGLNRSITASSSRGVPETIENVIQTDAAINPGNSGGPLVNIDGQVIGINTAIDVSGQLIGFAIPINDAKKDVEMVINEGKIIRPFVGIRYIPINEQIARRNNLPVDYGILVARGQSQADLAVLPGSPAEKAGIQENDIIIEVEGKKLTSEVNFSRLIAGYDVGETVTLKVLTGGEEKNVQVILEERTE